MHFLAVPSLRWRLVAVMCLAYIVVSVTTELANYRAQQNNLHTQLIRQAGSNASILAASAEALATGSPQHARQQLQDVLASIRGQSQGVEGAFVIYQNQIIAQTGSTRLPHFDPSAFVNGQQSIDMSNGRVAVVHTIVQYTLIGFAGVVVSSNYLQSALAQAILLDIGLRLIGLLIFVLLSLVIARYILGPLNVLYRAAEAIRRGQLSTRVSVHEGTEISTVAEAFNEMAGALEQRIAHLQFLAQTGAELPSTFHEAGHLDGVLAEFCRRLDIAGVCLLSPEESEEQDVIYARNPDDTAWLEPALRFARSAVAPKVGTEEGFPVLALGVAGGSRFVAARTGAGVFSLEEQQVVTNFAYQIGIAADNARLFEAQQEALRVKDQFLSIVSHELRTPLTTIKGYAQMLKFKLAGDSDGERFAATIDAQVGRLSRLVDDLLDVTRFARSQFDLRQERTELEPILDDVVSRFRMVAPNHTLKLDVRGDLPAGNWDHDRLEQVLNNLVSNAIKYSPEGGEVVVGGHQEGNDVVVTVRDQGMGIPPEDQAHLFERFFRGSAEGQDIKGMGLGLYVTRRIVEAHEGTISVASYPGKGSEFRFTLPLTPMTAAVD